MCIRDRVKLILSIFEPLTENGLTAKQRSILDRCAERVYRGYIRGGDVYKRQSLYSGIPLWITPCSITERCMGISLL